MCFPSLPSFAHGCFVSLQKHTATHFHLSWPRIMAELFSSASTHSPELRQFIGFAFPHAFRWLSAAGWRSRLLDHLFLTSPPVEQWQQNLLFVGVIRLAENIWTHRLCPKIFYGKILHQGGIILLSALWVTLNTSNNTVAKQMTGYKG